MSRFNIKTRQKINKIKNFWNSKINKILEQENSSLLLENKTENTNNVLMKKVLLIEGLLTELLALQLSKENIYSNVGSNEVAEQLKLIKRKLLHNKKSKSKDKKESVSQDIENSHDDL